LAQLQLQSSTGGQAEAAAPTDCDFDVAFFAGASTGALGVTGTDLLSEALPTEEARQQALQGALPAVEAQLQRRCHLVAAASGYGTDDYTGLPDHINQLQSTARGSSQVNQRSWRWVRCCISG
jgi:hypothetical protein